MICNVIINPNIWLILPGTQLCLDGELEVEYYGESPGELGLFEWGKWRIKSDLLTIFKSWVFPIKRMMLDYCSQESE